MKKRFLKQPAAGFWTSGFPYREQGAGKSRIYLNLWAYMEQEDKKLSEMFDDTKRSTAVFKIAAMIGHHLLDENGLTKFSEESRSRVETINERRCAAGARIDPAIDPFRRIW